MGALFAAQVILVAMGSRLPPPPHTDLARRHGARPTLCYLVTGVLYFAKWTSVSNCRSSAFMTSITRAKLADR